MIMNHPCNITSLYDNAGIAHRHKGAAASDWPRSSRDGGEDCLTTHSCISSSAVREAYASPHNGGDPITDLPYTP